MRLIVALALAHLLGSGAAHSGVATFGARALWLSAAAVLAGLLLAPGLSRAAEELAETEEPGPPWRGVVVWSALLGAGSGAWVVGDAWVGGTLPSSVAGPVLGLALGVALTLFALGGMNAGLARLSGDPFRARVWVLSLLGLSASGPLWLGPLAERLGTWPGVATAIVAMSPISYLAVLADTDYLRGEWFYAHSALGSLRFDYPGALTASAVYLLLGLLSLFGSQALQRKGRSNR
ncbi:MAG: hypothetical protein ACQGVK_01280 [Myxococcota bacterium]